MKAAGQRTDGPPRAPTHGNRGAPIGMPRRADFNGAQPGFGEPGFHELGFGKLGFDEEKITRPDAVPHMGTRRLPQNRSKTLRVIILAPL